MALATTVEVVPNAGRDTSCFDNFVEKFVENFVGKFVNTIITNAVLLATAVPNAVLATDAGITTAVPNAVLATAVPNAVLATDVGVVGVVGDGANNTFKLKATARRFMMVSEVVGKNPNFINADPWNYAGDILEETIFKLNASGYNKGTRVGVKDIPKDFYPIYIVLAAFTTLARWFNFRSNEITQHYLDILLNVGAGPGSSIFYITQKLIANLLMRSFSFEKSVFEGKIADLCKMKLFDVIQIPGTPDYIVNFTNDETKREIVSEDDKMLFNDFNKIITDAALEFALREKEKAEKTLRELEEANKEAARVGAAALAEVKRVAEVARVEAELMLETGRIEAERVAKVNAENARKLSEKQNQDALTLKAENDAASQKLLVEEQAANAEKARKRRENTALRAQQRKLDIAAFLSVTQSPIITCPSCAVEKTTLCEKPFCKCMRA